MTAKVEEKKHLSAKGLLGRVRNVFNDVSDPAPGKGGKRPDISLVDCLMSRLAVVSA